MHISEGVLSGPVLAAGALLTIAGTGLGLKTLDYDRIAHAGILSAAFFVASLIHINVGPASVHLVLNGLVGLLLGWGAFPAILVGLTLQCLLFQFGGLTVLGVNTFNLALPPVIGYFICRHLLWKRPPIAMAAAFCCGSLSVLLSALLLALSLIATEENFLEVAALAVIANFPVMIIEGFITAFCVSFLKKVQPAMLPGYPGT